MFKYIFFFVGCQIFVQFCLSNTPSFFILPSCWVGRYIEDSLGVYAPMMTFNKLPRNINFFGFKLVNVSGKGDLCATVWSMNVLAYIWWSVRTFRREFIFVFGHFVAPYLRQWLISDTRKGLVLTARSLFSIDYLYVVLFGCYYIYGSSIWHLGSRTIQQQ